MSYWDDKMKELEEEEKKKKKKTATPDSDDYWGKKMDELNNSSSPSSTVKTEDIAPVKDDRKWFEKGAFEDGYQFGDVTKTLFSSARDLESNVFAGILGIGEKVVDAGAYLVGGAADLVGADKFADKTKDFIAKDLYDEKKVADKILGVRDISSIVDTVSSKSSGKSFYGEENSVFGDKTDALAQSGGQLVATMGLQAVGVPWYLTTGVTSFGAETENAFNQGATYGQAGLSAAISAGAEILTEKLSGGIKFGGKALDEGLTKILTTNISNKALRTMAKLGMDVVGEGTEEVISQVFSNLGSALYKEEDLSEIMFSEEAFDEYLESFIGGAVLGGTGTVTGVVKGNVTGRDVTSGLTANEEKVLKQIYDERIKEAEQDGKKLTVKEKNAIYDEIKGEMENGYISTDKIESILGGDTYKSYQDTIAKEDAAIEELKTLYKGEELDRAVKDILDNSKRTEIKSKLSQEVADLATKGKDTYLSESYNEAARRKETFTADLSQYKTKEAQDTIIKAMESGVLNNTRRTHEFVDMIAKISADKGVLFDFTNNQKLAESGFAVEGKSVNGFVTKDGVTLNIDSQKALNSTVGHEITHVLEGTEFYDALQETIFEYAKTKGVYEDMLRNTKSLYENIEGYKGVDGFNAIKREVVSDLVGDYLFGDTDFINHLSTKNRNVFQKIYDEIKYLYKVATAGSKEAKELLKVKRAFEKAYQAEGKADGETKYSVSDSDGKKLTREQSEYFKDSKMRDENGALKVMYHGSQNAGFHVFDPSMSDDGTSLFFVDRNDVAASYSGTTETYAAKTIKTIDDFNKFAESIDVEGYEVTEKDGKFTLFYEGDEVATRDTMQEIYEEFCWYEGVGDGDANYKVYLNLTNPLEVDAKGRPWNKIEAEFSQEVYDKYNSLTTEEKAALADLAEWEDFRIFNSEIQEATDGALASAYAKMGEDCNIYDLFSVAADNFSEEAMRENSRKYLKTRDYAQKAKDGGHDGVIFKNIIDNGGYSNGDEGASTVAIAFDPNQIKSVANQQPTEKADIRYSLSEDSEGRELPANVKKRFANTKVVDENGSLKVVYHGTATGEFSIFDKSKGSVEGDFGSGFYFTDNESDVSEHYEGGGPDFDNKVARRAEQIEMDEEVDYDEAEERARAELFKGSHKFEVYLNIENPAIVGETMLLTNEQYLEQYNEEDYDDYDDYIADVEQLLSDDIENIVREVEKNVDLYSTDGIADVLYNAYYEGGIGIEELKSALNDLYLEDNNGNMVANEVARQIIESLGYDGIIDATVSGKWNMDIEEGTTHYIVFKPNQIKAVTNQNPTDNPDIHLSVSERGKKSSKHGRYNVYGKDVRLEQDIAPVGETVDKTASEAVPKYDLSPEPMPVGANESEIATLEARAEELERTMLERDRAGDATLEEASALYNEYMQTLDKIDNLKAQAAEAETQNAERLETLNEEPPEAEAPFYGDTEEAAPSDPFESRDYKAVGNQKQKAYMYENPEVKPFFQAEANVMLGELQRTTKGERWYNDQLYYETNGEKGFSGTKRHTSDDIAYLLDEGKGNGYGYTYAEIEAGLKAIIEDNGKENNACSKRIEFLLNDRLFKGYKDMEGLDVPANEDYVRMIHDKEIIEYSEEARKSFFDVADDYAPVAPVGEQMEFFDAPTQKQTVERKPFRPERKATEAAKEEKVAEVMVGEPEAPKKKKRSLMNLATDFVDKGAAVEKLSLKTKNRELQAKYNFMHYSENRAQSYIKNNLKPLLDKIEKTGKTKEIFDYAYHRHNISRMSLDTAENQAKREELRGKYFDGMSDKEIENTAKQWITHKTPKDAAERIKAAREYMDTLKTNNKPVFGDSVTADVSRKKVQQYENENPEFAEIGNALVEYNKALRQLMVDNNLISQETADLWAKEYPYYVPIRRLDHEGAAIGVPLDSRKTGVNAPIKRATGGNSDIGDLGHTMAMRTEQIFKAIARNNFGLELMRTLDSVVDQTDASLEEVTDSLDKQEELLKKGENGNAPTFTVFENGKRVEFEITEELYDSMRATSPELARTHLSSKAVEAFKKVTTQYNPKFMVSNPIKDIQDIILNSRHALKTYANLPKALAELVTRGRWYKEYMENGGEQNTYFDGEKKDFEKTFREYSVPKKILFGLPRGINIANDFMERAPRLAEYMASRKKGASIETAMLDAARVTTNFSAGGDVTKYVGRNFVPFLNPSVQGAAQQVRNVREAYADGFTGVLKLAGKYAVAGIPAVLLNALYWDDDEEYEELSDYVKENYYIVAKFDDGKFVRIPKGRTVSVLQSAVEQTLNVIQGEEFDFGSTGKLAVTNLAPNNPLDSNILSTWIQIQNNKTWYGEDLVPTRLQDVPKSEQYDESIDLVSKWLGEKLNVSPYHINYLIDQYTGGIGDALLPMITPETTHGETTLGDYAIAPYKDLFTTDSVMKNQNVSDFYETVDELTKNANSMHATSEDILKSKYMNSINSELGELYKKKREYQSDTTIPKDRKYTLVRRIQRQIDELAKEALNTYNNVVMGGDKYGTDRYYATVGDRQFRWYQQDDDETGNWVKLNDKQIERQNDVTKALGITPNEYWSNRKEEFDYAYDYPEKYSLAKAVGGFDAYKTYASDLYDIKADKDASGKTITGSRKKKVVAYINNLDADYYEKIILFKSEYTADDTYNYEIINYLNERDDISYSEMEMILKELGFTVDSKGNISWD